jgi:hypothetical protein
VDILREHIETLVKDAKYAQERALSAYREAVAQEGHALALRDEYYRRAPRQVDEVYAVSPDGSAREPRKREDVD